MSYIYKEIYYEGLVHALMKDETSQDLPSASWRPRKANSVIQSSTEALRARRVNGVSPNPRSTEDKMKCLTSTVKQKREQTLPSSVCCFIQSLKGLDDVHQHWEGCSTELTILNANLIQKQPHRHPKIMFNIGTLWSKLTRKINHHTSKDPKCIQRCSEILRKQPQ